MKKQKILILSIAAVAGMVLTGCNLTPDASTNDDTPDISVIEDEVETSDEVGTKVAIHASVTPTAQVNVSSAFGYEILDKTATSMSVRIIAVVDDYKNLTGASVTSKVVSARTSKDVAADNEETIKAEKTFNVTEVYSSLKDSSNISWNGTVDSSFANQYYIVYTLKNIPVANYFDTIIVKFSANSKAEDSKEFVVNANGVAGWDSRLTATAVSGSETDYSIKATYSDGADIDIPSDYYSVTDCYAVKIGKITTIESKAFGEDINKLTLPNTITTIKASAFYYVNVAEANIPSSLTSIAAGAFAGSYKITKLVYEATNLVNSNDTGIRATSIVIAKGVTSIPNKFFYSSNAPESIEFKGTEAEWNAMKTDDNASSGFYYLDVWCSDSSNCTVTFHYGEGKLGDKTGDVEVTARKDRVTENPGNPYLTGKEFKGWFTDAAGTNAFDFNSPITGDTDVYAYYGKASAGYSSSDPLLMSPSSSQSFSASLYPGKEYEWIKFTVPDIASGNGDWYYFSVDETSSKKDATTSTSTYNMDGNIVVYGSDATTLVPTDALDPDETRKTQLAWSIKNNRVAQYITQNDCGSVRVFAKPGETYYIKAALTNASDIKNEKYIYGTIAMNFFTFDNDSVGEAIEMSKDTALTPNLVSANQVVLYKYTSTKTETVLLTKTDHASSTYTSAHSDIVVVDAEDIGGDSPAKSLASKSSTGGYSLGFDAQAGHTYYIQLKGNYESSHYDADKYFDLSIKDAPDGYSKIKPLSYTLGESKTATQVYTSLDKYTSGAYYKFDVTGDAALYAITTTVGSSSYGQTVVVYDSNGEVVAGGTHKSASKGSAITASEITLSAGTYTAFVGYDGTITGSSSDDDYYGGGYGSSSSSKTTISSWKDFTFTISKVAVGDSINLPETITPTLDADTTVKSSANGRFYKFTATDDNYLIIDVSNVSSGTTVELLSESGDVLRAAAGGKVTYKTAKDTSYIVKVSGQDGNATVKFSRADTAETGDTADTAYSLSLDSNGLMDITSYAPSSGSQAIFFKYTAASTGTFKLFFQALKDGAGMTERGPSSDILNVYDSVSCDTTLTKSNYSYNDYGKHAETLGTSYCAYAEYAFTSGTTYYLKLSVPALATQYYGTADTLKFGVKEKPVGSAADLPDTGTTIDSASTSLAVTGDADGYWSKVTFSEMKNFSFTLPDSDTTIKIYKAGDTSAESPILTLSGTDASKSALFEAGDYLFCCQVKNAAAKTAVNVALTQSDVEYYTETFGKVESSNRTTAPSSGTASYGWSEMSDNPGCFKSGMKSTNNAKSVLIFHFEKAGTFTFDWACSGQNYSVNSDYLYVTHTSGETSEVVVNAANEGEKGVSSFSSLTWHTGKTVTVEAGDTITFLYTKDSSAHGTLDAAYIRNIGFTAAE